MKKRLTSFLLAFVLLIAVVPTSAKAAQTVSAAVASFKVTLNGVVMDNTYAQYPLIVYKDITYFPMTYHDCRFMAIETAWDNDTRTLSINAAEKGEKYQSTTRNTKNPQNVAATVVDYNVFINGKKIDNLSEPYPLLSFRDVTYFPMTWRFCVDEFDWEYSYTKEDGLIVNSAQKTTEPEKEPEQTTIVVPSVLLSDAVGGQNQITLEWFILDGRVDGYEVYQSTQEQGYYEKVATTTANVCTATITGLAEASAYYYKVRAFVVKNGVYHYGDFSNCKGAVTASSQKFSIELPDLPVTFSWYKYNGEVYSSASLTKVSYTTERKHDGTIMVKLYFSGTKTANGSGNLYAVNGEWALIEKSTGIVAATGSIYKNGLAVGDAFRNVEATAGLVGEGLRDVAYILEIYNK